MITLTDQQYAALTWTLRRIAGVTKIKADGTRSSKLSREAVELMARDACDQLRLTYDRKMMEEYLQLFGPDDPPLVPKLSTVEQRAAHRSRHTYFLDHKSEKTSER